jgi:ligand-binding SRPBCC domain-containing protein
MPVIVLDNTISAPIEICFDLSRSIDLHMLSTAHTGEVAIAGKISGLIGLGETVTWKARHFGIWLTLTSKITQYDWPFCFTDEMVEGPFHSFRHEHRFTRITGGTRMEDHFAYRSPLGVLGRIADVLFLQKYMKQLLLRRNQVIKHMSEHEGGPTPSTFF